MADNNTVKFPSVTALASYHELLDNARECVGDDHDASPSAVIVVVLRDTEVDQFMLCESAAVLSAIGGLDVVRQTMRDYVIYGGDDDCDDDGVN